MENKLPWYAVTISPMRVLAVLAGSGVWLCMLWHVVSYPRLDFFSIVGGGAWLFLAAAAITWLGVEGPNLPWHRLNPSITLGKPRNRRRIPKATLYNPKRMG